MTAGVVALFLALGAFVGFLAGLFGIGGGFTIVPVLVETFEHQGFATTHVLPLAIGTSAATIVFTAFSSARAHHKRGAVDWPIVRAFAPGLVAGSLLGPQIASALPTRVLAAVVGSIIWISAARMLWARPQALTRPRPGLALMAAAGSLIGLVAGMAGVGGAFLAVPMMTRWGVKIHTAVATSAAIGWPIAVASTIGFMFAGWGSSDLPPWSLGYVYLPALAAIAVMSISLAPLGARVAHAWPVARLRKGFALLLLVLGAWMWWKALR